MPCTAKITRSEIPGSLLLIVLLGLAGCGPASPDRTLSADVPLHLEEHLVQAVVTGSEVPENVPQPVIWSFDKAQPDWKAVPLGKLPFEPTRLAQTGDALRVTPGKSKNKERKFSAGAVYVDVPDWTPDDWAHVQVRARTSDKINWIRLGFNLREQSEKDDEIVPPIVFQGEPARVVHDGSVQTYSLRADLTGGKWEGKWRQLTLFTYCQDQGSIDILSVAVIPKEAGYADKENWGQRSLDLSRLAGQTVTLALENECERKGTVALWGAPTLTGAERGEKPNVIFYVIDGGAADLMSLYGYNRRTTPNLERLAAEGALFERAYSNSTSTKPSTASFMTSLQNSVMGGQTGLSDPVPEQVLTMAEHMHRAGYQTGVFIANPNAGTLSNLQRGVDMMRESWKEFAYFNRENHKRCSAVLGEAFWNWRENYPGEPYWVHFQATDVHYPQDLPLPAPFSGLFVSPEELKTWKEWNEKLNKEGGSWLYSKAWEKTAIDRVAYYTIWQALYDQSIAHNDHQLGRMVDRLKAEGEWENTLLIVAADHSTGSAGVDISAATQETLPPRWNSPMFRPSISRIPLLFIWPCHIKGGQRLEQPVSMIDVLPTILDLVDLPTPEIMIGQSLAPLLLGTEGWEPRPVIFDEFWFDREDNILRGNIEMVDGRWGASLEVNRKPPEKDENEEAALWRRPVPLLLYDLWNDYHCLNSIHEKRPDLVKKYTEFLEERWKAHQMLAQAFSRSGKVPFNPEQLETLRSLGYIR